jgi:hypothetical protein
MPFLRGSTITLTLAADKDGTTDSAIHLDGGLSMITLLPDAPTTTMTVTITTTSTGKTLLVAVNPSTLGSFYYPRMYPQGTTGNDLSTSYTIPIALGSNCNR